MLIDLSDRAKYRATGKDGARFLNGQLTNDILNLQPGSAIGACALTAKGKLCAELFVAGTDEGFYLDAESVLRESLAARLERYIIADDVTLEDVSDEFGLFHLVEPDSAGAGQQTTASLGLSAEGKTFLVESDRFGFPGIDVWFPRNQAAFLQEKLKQSPADSETA